MENTRLIYSDDQILLWAEAVMAGQLDVWLNQVLNYVI